MTFVVTLLLAFIKADIILVRSQSIPIDYTWNDTNSGWTDTDDSTNYIYGSLTTYHGWFASSSNNDYWYKTFSCVHYSTVTIGFTCNYGCDIEENEDGCYMYLETEEGDLITVEELYNGSSTSLSETLQNNCKDDKDHNGLTFSGKAFSYSSTTDNLYFVPDEEFVVSFRSYATENAFNKEYIGFSYISVTCHQVPTPAPTINPTNNPSNDPTKYPTNAPSIFPSTDPSTNPSTQPSKPSTNPSTHPSILPSIKPSANPSTDPTNIPSESTKMPTSSPVTNDPTVVPSSSPSKHPSFNPSNVPTTTQPTNDEELASDGGNSSSSEMDRITTLIIIISSIFVFILIQIFVAWFVRKKRKKEKSMNNFRADTILSDSTTVEVVNGIPMTMVVAQLVPEAETGHKCVTYEEEEKRFELQFELQEDKEFVKRSIISDEDVIIISGNETAGGVGWNEEFH